MKNNPSIALAIFVKTPGLSAIKTRLASGIGSALALEFYERSVKATEALAIQLQSEVVGLKVYWAVAEAQGISDDRWKSFLRIEQGEGALGDRLDHVYRKLLVSHDQVILMGADSPQIAKEVLIQGIQLKNNLKSPDFFVGPTDDGGFYFFAGRKPLLPTVWKSVQYSSETTCRELCSALQSLGEINYLPNQFDIDNKYDLLRLEKVNAPLLPIQQDLIRWVQNLNLEPSDQNQ